MLLADVLSIVLGVLGTDEVRHVSGSGHNEQDGSESKPYRTIRKALEARTPGRRLVIELHGSLAFTEPLELASDVVIHGPARIETPAGSRPVTIAGTSAARIADVELHDLELVATTSAQPIDRGGVVLVDNADGVLLRGCTITGGLAGRGGGVAVRGSRAVRIQGGTVRGNRAGTPETTLAGADLAEPYDMTLPVGDGHGGGIYVEDSDVEIHGVTVTENRAILFGGGIGVRNTLPDADPPAPPSHDVDIFECEVTLNQVSHGPLGALTPSARAAAPPSMGDPVFEAFRDPAISEARERGAIAGLHGANFESGLGGGVAIRHADASTRVRSCWIGTTRAGAAAPNLARRGAGVHLYFGAYPLIERCTIAHNLAQGDGGGVGVDLFDPVLPPDEDSAFGVLRIPMITRAPIQLRWCTIRDNYAIEDGGGIYATGAAIVEVREGAIRGNRAGENGGGIRVTYAADLYAEGVTFDGNRANIVPGGSEGGGAVASRNASVHLERCTLTGNVVRGFAGGAVYFTSMFEGGFWRFGLLNQVEDPSTPGNDRFDRIMAAAYRFGPRVLRIHDCVGAGNSAFEATGAGGFLYAVRTPAAMRGTEPMWVNVAGAGTSLGANQSEHAGRKRGNVVIELSGLLDPAGDPIDLVAIGREVPAAGIPPSITPSSAPLPPASGPALCVMPDAVVANDVVQATYGGGGWFNGPQPVLTAVTPGVARLAGGTVLTIAGGRFQPESRVRIGPREAVDVNVSPGGGQITCTTPPAAAAGTFDVEVVVPSGAQGWLTGAVKVVPPPRITFMSTLKGRAGDQVTVRGKGMPPGTTVHFVFGARAVEAAVAPTTADDQLLVTVPPAPAGARSALVRATSPTGEQFTRPPKKAFTYLP